MAQLTLSVVLVEPGHWVSWATFKLLSLDCMKIQSLHLKCVFLLKQENIQTAGCSLGTKYVLVIL